VTGNGRRHLLHTEGDQAPDVVARARGHTHANESCCDLVPNALAGHPLEDVRPMRRPTATAYSAAPVTPRTSRRTIRSTCPAAAVS
jgi:hypothetical protein